MGESLTPTQKSFLSELIKEAEIVANFYLTGGTALAAFYFHHRESEDLDLFSEAQFDEQRIINFVVKIGEKIKARILYEKIFDRLTFDLSFARGQKLKVDFAHYLYPRLAKSKLYFNLKIDSLLDIAVNKLMLLTQRNNPKDFVDLYFLLKKFSLWDLIYGVEKKFKIEPEPLFLGGQLLKAEEIDVLPVMTKKITLSELKDFFKKEARKLGEKLIE